MAGTLTLKVRRLKLSLRAKVVLVLVVVFLLLGLIVLVRSYAAPLGEYPRGQVWIVGAFCQQLPVPGAVDRGRDCVVEPEEGWPATVIEPAEGERFVKLLLRFEGTFSGGPFTTGNYTFTAFLRSENGSWTPFGIQPALSDEWLSAPVEPCINTTCHTHYEAVPLHDRVSSPASAPCFTAVKVVAVWKPGASIERLPTYESNTAEIRC